MRGNITEKVNSRFLLLFSIKAPFKRGMLLTFFSCIFISGALAQTVITGKITDSGNQPLPGVSVLVKNTKTGTSSDLNGDYRISIPEGNNVLIFRFIGFVNQEVEINRKTQINVSMIEDASKLDEVVVVGYGSQSRELLSTSVSKLDTKVLENIPYTNAASALQGTIAGLRVQTTSGQPGDAPRVILRGGTSINNPNGAEPLYIIDGIQRTTMNNIAADDIESIQVLKDAAATSIYGARASNGVIIVITKSGKPGETKIAYSYDLTAATRGRTLEYVSAADYIYYNRLGIAASAVKNPNLNARNQLANGSGTGNDLTNNTAYTTQYLSPANQHKLNEGWQSMPDPLDPTKTIIFNETNYQDLIYRTGISHNNYITASGGTEKATFNVGAGYLLSQGSAIETDYKRLSLNFNSTLTVTDNLNVSGRLNYSNTSSDAIASEAGLFRNSAYLPGTSKFRFEDGTLAPGQSGGVGNPIYFLQGPGAPKGDNDYDNLSMSLQSHWDILPGLSFEPQLSLYKVKGDSYNFRPAYLNGVGNFTDSRIASASYSRTSQYQAEGVLTYVKSFVNAHNFEFKLGGSHFGRETYSQSGSGQGAATDLIPTLNASALATAVGGNKSNLVIQGLFSRINYDYKGKYLMTINGRYDGASNLGAGYRFGFFPGVSVGWNLHREEFWKALPEDLLTLKLRASYGENGNISDLGDFQAQGTYGVGNQYFNNPAVLATVFPNPDLRWEQSRTFDFGFDMGLFNRRVSVIFDYYNRITDDLLTDVALPGSSGFSVVRTNLGSLGNRGVELELAAQVLSSASPFQWNVSFNAARVKSKILELPANGIENNRVGGVLVWDALRGDYVWKGGLQEGGRIGDMYSYRQIGVYATDADAAKAPVDMIVPVSTARPADGRIKYGGDVNWEDLDGNNIIDTRDQVYLGNPYPVWTGGFTNSFGYKNFNLYIRTDFATGHTINDTGRSSADGQSQGDVMPTKEFIEKMWKKQGDITNTPRYLWQNQQGNIARSSVYYQLGDYLALREVTLSYAIPLALLQKVKLSNFRLNLTGNNLHYFTKYKGLNPETGGNDAASYPVSRNFTFGANITF